MTTTHISDNMLRKILLTLLIIFAIGATPIAAQRDGGKGKRHSEMIKDVQEFKIKYIIQEAEITKEQQAEFIRLYTEMSNAKLTLLKAHAEKHKALAANPSPTDNDYNKVSEEIAESKSAEGAIDKSYYLQFKKILTPKQLYKMKEAELHFNSKMMHMRKNRRKK